MADTANPQSQDTTGLPTDAQGKPTIDPSKNVLDLVDAAIERQDDLRDADDKRYQALREEEGRHVRELIRMQAQFSMLRAEHAREIRDKEESRIDAIRAVDRQAVKETAEVQATQQSTIAVTLAQTAEAMRAQVAAVAQQTAAAQAAALEPIQKAIDDLRRAQYEAQGQKTQVIETRATDADMKPMADAIATLAQAQAEAVGGRNHVAEQRLDLNTLIPILSLIAIVIFFFASK